MQKDVHCICTFVLVGKNGVLKWNFENIIWTKFISLFSALFASIV